MKLLHYVAPFTDINGRKQKAACGLYVRADEIAPRETAPTCPDCLLYCEADAATAAELSAKYGDSVDAQAEGLFGSSEEAPRLGVIEHFSSTDGYRPKGGMR
jgi:hypothetical protein